MKIDKFYLLIVMGIIVMMPLFGQSDCKVLKDEISIEYKGDCKDGLAHGQGEATGIDHYKGSFKKGFPHGEGTYKWYTGESYEGQWKKGMRNGTGTYYYFNDLGRDTLLTGKWKDDKYLEPGLNKSTYRITYKDNIGRISVNRYGEGDFIKIKVMRGGVELVPTDLMLSGDSGTTRIEQFRTGFEQVIFPFKGKATFSAMNAFNASLLRCELRFEIYQPGSYTILIYL